MNIAQIQHHKDIDIPAWEYRSGDWFTVRLFDLMAHADTHNFTRLALAFPEAGAAFIWWKQGKPELVCLHCGTTLNSPRYGTCLDCEIQETGDNS